jgi:hypothetical protein
MLHIFCRVKLSVRQLAAAFQKRSKSIFSHLLLKAAANSRTPEAPAGRKKYAALGVGCRRSRVWFSLNTGRVEIAF